MRHELSIRVCTDEDAVRNESFTSLSFNHGKGASTLIIDFS